MTWERQNSTSSGTHPRCPKWLAVNWRVRLDKSMAEWRACVGGGRGLRRCARCTLRECRGTSGSLPRTACSTPWSPRGTCCESSEVLSNLLGEGLNGGFNSICECARVDTSRSGDAHVFYGGGLRIPAPITRIDTHQVCYMRIVLYFFSLAVRLPRFMDLQCFVVKWWSLACDLINMITYRVS